MEDYLLRPDTRSSINAVAVLSIVSLNHHIFVDTVLASANTLIVRQIPWSSYGLHGTAIRYRSTQTGTGNAALVKIQITQRTLVQGAYGMGGLRSGSVIFAGGALEAHQLSAFVIADVSRSATTAARNRPPSLFHAISGIRVHDATRFMHPAAPRRMHARPLDTTSNPNFTGGFGGPSYNYNTSLNDIDIFDIGIFSVHLKSFGFLAALDGWTYNWPFTFSGTANGPLTITQPGSVNLNVQPQPGGSGSYSDTFSGGIGINFGIGFHIYTAVGCGTLDLQSCDFYPTANIGVGMLNKTQGAAPMSGTDLSVPAVDCPSIGLNIPDTSISAADVGVCASFVIHGTNFGGYVTGTGATVSPENLSFDGVNAQSVPLTPTQSAIDLNMSNFNWVPTLDFGLYARLRVAMHTIFSTPSVTITSGSFPMIADAATRSAAGFNDVSGQFAQISSSDFLFQASKDPTSIAYGGVASGDYHDPATVSATLSDGLGRAVPGKMLTFILNGSGTELCSATTNLAGVASCSITPTDVPNLDSIAVSYPGDASYLSSSVANPFTITKEESSLNYSGPTTQDYHDVAPVSANLVEDAGGPAISGQPLTFTLGTQSCNSTSSTDSNGAAGCSINLNQAAGQINRGVAFAGNSYYLPSSSTLASGFNVTHEETSTTYTGPLVILKSSGAGVTLKAQLLEDHTLAPVPFGQTMTLTVGSGPQLQSCTGTTDATGVAQCTISQFNGSLGSEPLGASFAGDSYYSASADTAKSAIVFSFPSSGAFVLGDSTVAASTSSTNVPWWGATWSSLNSLSGGSAPSAFKGFADNATLPTSSPVTVCGGTFTTRPGNSSTPPSSVPAYMGVLVSSSITQSGSAVSGKYGKIVVVKTAVGYAGNPGHPGGGTIVATFCP